MKNTLKTLVLTAMVAVVAVIPTGAFARYDGGRLSVTLHLDWYVGVRDLVNNTNHNLKFAARYLSNNGVVFSVDQILFKEIDMGTSRLWEVHTPEYPTGVPSGLLVKLLPGTEVTLYWKGGTVVNDIDELKNLCAVSNGTVSLSREVRAPFAFAVKMGTHNARPTRWFPIYKKDGKPADILEKGEEYLAIDAKTYKRFIPSNFEEVKALGQNPEIVEGGSGVRLSELYDSWVVPAVYRVHTEKRGVVSPEGQSVSQRDGSVIIYGPAVAVPAPSVPEPSLPAPGDNSGGEGGGGGCNAGFAGWLIAMPALAFGRKRK